MNATECISRKFADIFVSLFNDIEGDWVKPWIRPGVHPQQNMAGNVYNGTNMTLTQLISMSRGYDLPVWLTFNQAKENGLSVLAGEKSIPVVHYDFYYRENESGNRVRMTDEQYKALDSVEKDKYRRCCSMTWSSVFNIAQTDMAEKYPAQYEDLRSELAGLPERIVDCPVLDGVLGGDGRWLCSVTEGADIREPLYDEGLDHIFMPSRESFTDRGKFYGTLVHEMAHCVGSECREDRNLSSPLLSDMATEELVAELTSATVCSMLSLEATIDTNNLRYLKQWSQAIDGDPDIIFSAVREASKSAGIICDTLGITQMQGVALTGRLVQMDEAARQRQQEYKQRKANSSKMKRSVKVAGKGSSKNRTL